MDPTTILLLKQLSTLAITVGNTLARVHAMTEAEKDAAITAAEAVSNQLEQITRGH